MNLVDSEAAITGGLKAFAGVEEWGNLAGFAAKPESRGCAAGAGSDGPNGSGVLSGGSFEFGWGAVVDENGSWGELCGDDDIGFSIAVEVRSGCSASEPWFAEPGTGGSGGIGESSVVVGEDLWLHLEGLSALHPGAVIDVSVSDEDIIPAVAIKIFCEGSEAEFLAAGRSECGGACGILKTELSLGAVIEVERIGIAIVVGEEQIGESIMIEVAGSDTHGGLGVTDFVESGIGMGCIILQSDAGNTEIGICWEDFDGEQEIRFTVICDVDFGEEIAVKITDNDAESFTGELLEAGVR